MHKVVMYKSFDNSLQYTEKSAISADEIADLIEDKDAGLDFKR